MINMIWLATSIFCSRRQWQYSLFRSIKLFIEAEKSKQFLEDYIIEVNYLSGENLRLSLLTKQKNAVALAKSIDDHFQQYFATFICEDEVKLPVQGVFLPFNHCIRYGLYPPKKLGYQDVKDYSFSIKFSQIFVDALKEEGVDDEALFTVAFYMQIGFINAMLVKHPQFREGLKSTFWKTPPKGLDVNIVVEKFNDNKTALLEIIKYIEVTPVSEKPTWLKNWSILCNEEISKMDFHTRLSSYNSIILSIYNHFGINKNTSYILSYFIEHSIFS